MASVYMVVHQLEKDALNSCVITVANITVNLLAGLHGVEYMNTVQGASDTIEFPRFFGEAGRAANIETARPVLEVGDIVVRDNCATHHFAGGEALQEWLNERNIELVYTPTYSPDFNPAEFIFNKMRSVMCYHLWDLTNENTELAAYEAVDHITSHDVANFLDIRPTLIFSKRKYSVSLFPQSC